MRSGEFRWLESVGQFATRQRSRARKERMRRVPTKRSLAVESLESRTLLSVAPGISTIGLVNLSYSGCDQFQLKNTDIGSTADNTFLYGSAGWKPVAGDWDNNGTDTPGVYNGAASYWYLRNSNTEGGGNIAFAYGAANAGWIPITGDWNGDGVDTIGLYIPSTSTFCLRNSNSEGVANLQFTFGAAGAGWIPIAGDWNGDGVDTIGLYNGSTSTYYLRNTNNTGYADIMFDYGAAASGWKPIVGDWNGDGTDTPGILNPNGTQSIYYLRNTNTTGGHDISCQFGIAGANWTPIAGNWTGRVFPTMTFTDAAVENQTRFYYGRDGYISRNAAIAILQTTGSDNGSVDANELADCRTIVTSSSSLGMSNYVKVLSNDVVNSNPANAHYLGQDLGDLAAGDSNAKLSNLINKWFRGTDHPAAPSCTYLTAAGSLFVSGPSIGDMDISDSTGDYIYVENSSFITALGSIAGENATDIQNMFVDNGDNTYTVRFYYLDDDTYVADYVTVDRQLPTDGTYISYAGDGNSYSHPSRHAYNDASGELWLSLVEKAYAQWNESGRADRPNGSNGYNDYVHLASGDAGVIAAQVLGRSVAEYDLDSNKQVLLDAIAANKAVTVHCIWQQIEYDSVITAYNSGTDTFTLRDAHGFTELATWTGLQSEGDHFVVADVTTTALPGYAVSPVGGDADRSISAPVASVPIGWDPITGTIYARSVDIAMSEDLLTELPSIGSEIK